MKQLTGKVISTKMQKTVVVQVTNNWEHPLYKKVVKRTKNFAAHNTIDGVAEGDTVVIQETRPMSKTVHFKVIKKA